jgi:Protein of unknown function (DUF2971)
MHQLEDNYLNLIGTEEIYRAFGLTRFFDMFHNRHNVPVKPRLWDDPFENFILNAKQHLRTGEKGIFKFKDYIFGQCWSLKAESDAMWRIYSTNKDGVKVKTTVRQLCSALFNQVCEFREVSAFIGKVEYKPEAELRTLLEDTSWVLTPDGKGIAKALLFKRMEFEHEEEVRLIFSDAKQQCTDDIVKYVIDPNDLFSEIVFDPRMSDEMFDIYNEHLTQVGFKGVIAKSALYKLELEGFKAKLPI